MPHTDHIEQRWIYCGKGFDSASELRALRKAAGWSQEELAQRVGVHVCTVKYHEAAEGRIVGVAPRRFREEFDEEGIVLGNRTNEPAVAARKLCGAQTRSGAPCKAKAMPDRCRCKLHGGMSTGPKSAAGRERIAQAQKARWERFRTCEGVTAR
jgi:hypothetical protein